MLATSEDAACLTPLAANKIKRRVDASEPIRLGQTEVLSMSNNTQQGQNQQRQHQQGQQNPDQQDKPRRDDDQQGQREDKPNKEGDQQGQRDPGKGQQDHNR